MPDQLISNWVVMPKYYAVKIGRNPGMYRSWSECKLQTDGFSGAVYKSFKTRTDAETFLGKSKSRESPSDSTILEIFTDGSHRKHDASSNMGYGILFRYNNSEFGLSRHPLSLEDLNDTFGGHFESVSNPTMEFAAVAHALQLANQHFPEAKQIHITYDYIGSKNWITGRWKCRKPHIKNIHRFVQKELEILGDTPVIWTHVKSHTGHRENEMADLLASGIWPKDLMSLE